MKLLGARRRELGYAEITSTVTATALAANTDSDITGLSITITAGNYPIMLTAYIPTITHSVASAQWQGRLYEGATQLQASSILTPASAGGGAGSCNLKVRLNLAPGSTHTFKVAMRSSTTGNLSAIGATAGPAYIQAIEV